MFRVVCPGCATGYESESSDAICPACGVVTDLSVVPADAAASAASSVPASWTETPLGMAVGVICLILALMPLSIALLFGGDNVEERLRRTLAAHPEVRLKFETGKYAKLDELLADLPEGRIEGSYLAVDSKLHWLYSGLSAAGFLILGFLLVPRGHSTRSAPMVVALFTGTVGMALLALFQLFAEWTQGYISSNPVFLVIRMIGYSYRAALDPQTGFVMSFIGFTFGVGLCEELLKALPVYWHFRRRSALDWRGALMWGIASGVGFGVVEGLFYSADFYNGVSGSGIYLVRFVSCVALHAVWTAGVSLAVWEDQAAIFDAESVPELVGTIPGVLFIPMVLHGLYDTLLKRGPEGLAALVALASVGWLAWRLGRVRAQEARVESAA